MSEHVFDEKKDLLEEMAGKDIFQAVECIWNHLAKASDQSQQWVRFTEIMGILHDTTLACMEKLTKSRDCPVLICHGKDADFLWLYDEFKSYYCAPREIVIQRVLNFLKTFSRDFEYAERTENFQNVKEMIVFLENQYNYLTNIIGTTGLHVLAFPELVGPHSFDCRVSYHNHSTSVQAYIFPIGIGDSNFDACYFVYLSAVAAIIDRFDLEHSLSPTQLDLLEEFWDAEIRNKSHEDQIISYYNAVLLGLSYQAPYIDLSDYDSISAEHKMVWQNHVKTLIQQIGEEAYE